MFSPNASRLDGTLLTTHTVISLVATADKRLIRLSNQKAGQLALILLNSEKKRKVPIHDIKAVAQINTFFFF